MKSKVLLSVDQAAERLGLSPATLRTWIALRKIESVKIGKLRKVPEECVDQYIRDHTDAVIPGRA